MDNQINQENWFDSMTRNAIDGLNKLTIIKKPVKHIPIIVWEEIPTKRILHWADNARSTRYANALLNTRWSNGVPYIITVVNNDK